MASAAPVETVREYREVPGAGVFTTCADGTDVTFASLSYRDYTTWLLDGVAVRENFIHYHPGARGWRRIVRGR